MIREYNGRVFNIWTTGFIIIIKLPLYRFIWILGLVSCIPYLLVTSEVLPASPEFVFCVGHQRLLSGAWISGQNAELQNILHCPWSRSIFNSASSRKNLLKCVVCRMTWRHYLLWLLNRFCICEVNCVIINVNEKWIFPKCFPYKS